MNNAELSKKVWGYLKGSVKLAKKFEDLVAVSITLISENTEELFVAVRNGELMVEPYRYNDNNCSIEASEETVDKIFSGELSFDKALKDGYVEVKSGDVAKFKALEVLVPKKASKAAPKKTETKAAAKTETKASPKAEAKPAAKAEVKAAPKAAEVKTETKTAPAKAAAPVAAPKAAEVKTETKPAAAPAKTTAPAAKPAKKHGKH